MFGFGINKVIYDNGRKRKRVACNTLSIFIFLYEESVWCRKFVY